MKKFILTHGELESDIAYPWELIPEDAIEIIDRDYITKVLYFSMEAGVERQSAIFLREVESFKRGIKKFKIDDITVGVE